ncbi:uncharacterized protein LOC114125192 isoform X1 [Aphis gossypii]|nr:uncharacterized protein LOC114125192 isoform X1 [Aphis gossypii]
MADSVGNRTNLQRNEPHSRPTSFISPELQLTMFYHQSLKALYQYLGDELDTFAGSTSYKSVVINTVPLLFMKLNVMPGEIASIIANSSNIKFILQYALSRNRPFGIVHKINEDMPTYGVLVAIYNHSLIKESIETKSYEVQIRGLQLFKIHHFKPFPDRNNQTLALARIEIIPIETSNHPYNELCLNPNKYNSSIKFSQKNMWQSQWPSLVYKQFDVYELASRIFKKVRILYKDIKFSNIPSILSFQVTKLGIFTHEEVNELLGIESTNLRLQLELGYFIKHQSMQKLRCSRVHCGIPISNMSYVVPISPKGIEDSYCGSWGALHTLVTVTHLEDNLKVIKSRDVMSEYFWRIGYKNSIIFCPNCRSYLGWFFSVKDNLLSSSPRSFYGLSIDSVTSIDDHILPLVSSDDELPLEQDSDRGIIFEAINDTDILETPYWTFTK